MRRRFSSFYSLTSTTPAVAIFRDANRLIRAMFPERMAPKPTCGFIEFTLIAFCKHNLCRVFVDCRANETLTLLELNTRSGSTQRPRTAARTRRRCSLPVPEARRFEPLLCLFSVRPRAWKNFNSPIDNPEIVCHHPAHKFPVVFPPRVGASGGIARAELYNTRITALRKEQNEANQIVDGIGFCGGPHGRCQCGPCGSKLLCQSQGSRQRM